MDYFVTDSLIVFFAFENTVFDKTFPRCYIGKRIAYFYAHGHTKEDVSGADGRPARE